MSVAENNAKTRRLGVWALATLCALGAALFLTNPHFTFLDDEVSILYGAALPAGRILGPFLHGTGMHEHPPLYDMLLHAWLRLTGERLWALRLPSIAFYLAGIWILALAATRVAGARAGRALVWIAALWPYGFLYGRLAAWYSFCFLLVALVTFVYLRLVESKEARDWILFAICCLALVWANYFAWAIIACLGADYLLRRRRDMRLPVKPWALVGLTLVVGYLPFARAFWHEIVTHPAEGGHHLLVRALYGVYALYALAVSESMAPWFWWLGIPGAVGTAVLLMALAWGKQPGRRFFGYFCALFALMMLLGILTTKRLLLISPWFLLPAAALTGWEHTPATAASRKGPARARKIFLTGLAVTFAIGWFGIIFPSRYAAPRFIEPWPHAANEAATALGHGAIVIGNNSSFFFYLGYAIASGSAHGAGRAAGPLTVFPYPGVYLPNEWLAAGRPLRSTVFLAKGVPVFGPSDATVSAERWLDGHCRLVSDARAVPDSGYRLKQRFFPHLGELPWRVETRRYACTPSR